MNNYRTSSKTPLGVMGAMAHIFAALDRVEAAIQTADFKPVVTIKTAMHGQVDVEIIEEGQCTEPGCSWGTIDTNWGGSEYLTCEYCGGTGLEPIRTGDAYTVKGLHPVDLTEAEQAAAVAAYTKA